MEAKTITMQAQEGVMEMIKQSEAFRTISEIKDWDYYFEKLRVRLTKELFDLKN